MAAIAGSRHAVQYRYARDAGQRRGVVDRPDGRGDTEAGYASHAFSSGETTLESNARCRDSRSHDLLPRHRTAALLPVAVAAIGVACLASSGRSAASEVAPNVIVILSDDQGSVDMGCYGAADLATPHMDALAARGVRFTQFYSGAPVCSPSRACLLTGRYTMRNGLLGNAGSQHGQKAGLSPDEVTLGEVFRAAGYATAQIGKWHLGYTDEMSPLAQGFDHAFGHMGGCIDNYSHFFYWSGPNVHDLHRDGAEVHCDGQYFPDLMLREASAFLEAHRDEPFFLYYALNTPHYPYQGEARWLEHFRNLPHPRNLYAAFLASQDERIGGLLAKVDELGLRERTIVVFQSDNGHSTEERAHFGGGSAGPYRGAKFSLFEGGIRLPAIVAWPGTLPEGEVRHQAAHAVDWLPTLTELCGIAPPDVVLDGRSLVPVIESAGAAEPHTALHWQTGNGPGATWAVREGDWKLIANAWDTSRGDNAKTRYPIFLANLRDDPGEQTNLADQHPEVVRRLTQLHENVLNEE